MTKFKDFQPQGTIPACLLPFDTDYAIDESAYRRHLRDVDGVEEITAITVNGHASEVHACTLPEQERVLDIALEEVGDRRPIINGVYADGSHQAGTIAQMATKRGASALLVFPPNSMIMGGQLKPDMAVEHFRRIADVTDLPLIVFQYPLASGLGYPFDTLLRLVNEVPRIQAVKDWCNDPMLHERHIFALQEHSRPVNVLTTHSAWLMGSLVMGCKGLLSGAGSVIADLQLALFRAVQRGDLTVAQTINRRIHPVAQAFYAPPFLDMHNRMKEALVLLGRQKRAVVRPPLTPISAAERERLRIALAQAQISAEGAVGLAA